MLQIGDEEPLVGREGIVDRLGHLGRLDPAPRLVRLLVASTHFRSVTPEAVETAYYFRVLTDVGLDRWAGTATASSTPLAHRHVVTNGS